MIPFDGFWTCQLFFFFQYHINLKHWTKKIPMKNVPEFIFSGLSLWRVRKNQDSMSASYCSISRSNTLILVLMNRIAAIFIFRQKISYRSDYDWLSIWFFICLPFLPLFRNNSDPYIIAMRSLCSICVICASNLALFCHIVCSSDTAGARYLWSSSLLATCFNSVYCYSLLDAVLGNV